MASLRLGQEDEPCFSELCPFILPVWHPCWQDMRCGARWHRMHSTDEWQESRCAEGWGGGRGEPVHSITGVYQKEQFQLGSVSSWEPEWLMLWTAFGNACCTKGPGKMNVCVLNDTIFNLFIKSLRREERYGLCWKDTVLQVRGPIFFSIFNV